MANFFLPGLHRAGFANQATFQKIDDGLVLRDVYIGAVARCAPPANKPTPQEIANCLPFLEAELEVLRPRAVLALGQIAWTHYLRMLIRNGKIETAAGYRLRPWCKLRIAGGLAAPLRFLPPQPAEYADRPAHARDVSERLAQDSAIPRRGLDGVLERRHDALPLFVAQRYQGVYFRRTARWNPAGG